MPNGVSKETFEHADTDSKLNILFDQQLEIVKAISNLKSKDSNISDHYRSQWFKCDARFKNIEKKWYRLAGGLIFVATVAPIISALLFNYFI